jgi:hypothetical protein
MKQTNLLLGIAPWVLFSMIAERLGADLVGAAALVAGAGSLFLAVRGMRESGLKVIDAAGVVTFAVLAVVGFLGDHHVRTLLVDYGRGGCAVVLALVMFVSALTVPFTEQYARAEVDRRYWGSPVFRATNRRISLMWAGLIAVMAASHLTQGAPAGSGSSFNGNLLLNWVVPVLLVLIGMRRTQRIAAESAAPAQRTGVAV